MDDLVNDNLDFPFPDAVQEFSAQTSNMGVEQGGLSGGALNVITKSGTNSHARRRFLVRPEHGAECEQLLLARAGPVEAQSVRVHGGRTVHQKQALRLHGLPEADHPPGSGQHPRADPHGGGTARRFFE